MGNLCNRVQHFALTASGIIAWQNKTVFSFLRQLTTWHCSHLLPNAVLLCAVMQRRPTAAAVDRYRLPAGPAAANPPYAAVSVARWNRKGGQLTDKRTESDRQTDTVPLHRPCRILCGSRVDKIYLKSYNISSDLLRLSNFTSKQHITPWCNCFANFTVSYEIIACRTLRRVDVQKIRFCSEHDLLQDDSEAVDVSFLSSVDRSSCHSQQFRRRPQLITITMKLSLLCVNPSI